jgi:hypothetical protein
MSAADPRRQQLDEWRRAKQALPKVASVPGAKPSKTVSTLEQALIDMTSEMSELLVGIESSVARMAATYEWHITSEASDASDALPPETLGRQKGHSQVLAVPPLSPQARSEQGQQRANKPASAAPFELISSKAQPSGTSAARPPVTASSSARRATADSKAPAMPGASFGKGGTAATPGNKPAPRSASASRTKSQAPRGSASTALCVTPDLDAILARAQRTRQLAARSGSAVREPAPTSASPSALPGTTADSEGAMDCEPAAIEPAGVACRAVDAADACASAPAQVREQVVRRECACMRWKVEDGRCGCVWCVSLSVGVWCVFVGARYACVRGMRDA